MHIQCVYIKTSQEKVTIVYDDDTCQYFELYRCMHDKMCKVRWCIDRNDYNVTRKQSTSVHCIDRNDYNVTRKQSTLVHGINRNDNMTRKQSL